MQSLDALLFSMAYTIYGLYAVKAAALGPLELTLVGTIMELAIFLTEIPTGIVADLYSRRLSVILGLCIIGTGIALIGVVPTFWCIALGSVLLGIGGTCISGAHQAWLADEIGDVQATPVYMRATQLSQVGSLVGIPLNVTLASVQLRGSGHLAHHADNGTGHPPASRPVPPDADGRDAAGNPELRAGWGVWGHFDCPLDDEMDADRHATASHRVDESWAGPECARRCSPCSAKPRPSGRSAAARC